MKLFSFLFFLLTFLLAENVSCQESAGSENSLLLKKYSYSEVHLSFLQGNGQEEQELNDEEYGNGYTLIICSFPHTPLANANPVFPDFRSILPAAILPDYLIDLPPPLLS